MSLTIENAVGEVASVNVRKELHGEDLRLACDIRVAFKRDSGATGYDALAGAMLATGIVTDAPVGTNDVEDPTETLAALAGIAESLTFAAAWENHRVSIRQGTRKVAILSHAKINKGKIDDGGVISVRIQSEVDRESVGRLAAALRESVSVDVSPAQTELDLAEPDDDETVAD